MFQKYSIDMLVQKESFCRSPDCDEILSSLTELRSWQKISFSTPLRFLVTKISNVHYNPP